jgi:hypothetical protein
MKSQYDNRLPELRANLRTVWAQVTIEDMVRGQAWYADAQAVVREWSRHYGLSIETVASVVAALSPQCRWGRNLVCATNVLDERPMSLGEGAFPENYRKAEAILRDRADSILPYFKSAPKVASFQQNLQGNMEFVTVDTHAAQAALNDPTAKISLKWAAYVVFASAFASNAAEVGLTPAEYQAILWVAWKRLYPPADKRSRIRKAKVTKYRKGRRQYDDSSIVDGSAHRQGSPA